MAYETISNDAARRISRTVLRSEADALARSFHLPTPSGMPHRRSTTEILIRNDTGVDLEAYQIVGLDDPLVLPTTDAFLCEGRPAFIGVTPTVADHLGKWVPICDAAKSSSTDLPHSFARAVLVGHAVVRVYVNATDDKFCDVIPLETVEGETVYLGTGSSGVPILWLDPEAEAEEIAYAVVCMGGVGTTPLWGKLDADLLFDDDVGVTFSIWELNEANVWTDTLKHIPNVLPPIELAHALVPSDVWVSIEQRGGKWYVCEFPKHYQGILQGDLAPAGTATVYVPDQYGDTFTGCKALTTQTATIEAGTAVQLTLMSDGYYYVDSTSSQARFWGKLDADLAYNNTTGVTFSIWALNGSNAWADTTENIANVLPPAGLAHALVPTGVMVAVEEQNGKWYVTEFPKHYEGVLQGALAVAGTAIVYVPNVDGDSFSGCKATATQTASIAAGTKVRITLQSDGYYYVYSPLVTTYWGKLDADLAYNDTTGVTFSIWALDSSNAWVDTTENISNVLPPFELAHALVPLGLKIKIELRNEKWYVCDFPKHYQGILQGALAVSGTATVYVPDPDGDTFSGCKALEVQTEEIPSSSDVRITLMSDGYYYVDLAPC